MNDLIFINGVSKRLRDHEFIKISSNKELIDDIDNGKIYIDSFEKAVRWYFVEVGYELTTGDIIDVSLVEAKIRKKIRISKINDILK